MKLPELIAKEIDWESFDEIVSLKKTCNERLHSFMKHLVDIELCTMDNSEVRRKLEFTCSNVGESYYVNLIETDQLSPADLFSRELYEKYLKEHIRQIKIERPKK